MSKVGLVVNHQHIKRSIRLIPGAIVAAFKF
jgi:hypothetical protein